MFTGIVEERGTILALRQKGSAGFHLEVTAKTVLEGTKAGDSIAVNGVCLTVTHLRARSFRADIMSTTVRATGFGRNQASAVGRVVNLERALTLSSRLGGHLVSGHVDGVATVQSVDTDGIARVISFTAEKNLLRYIASKGSVTLDGISLTVCAIGSESFSVSLIPHTLGSTTAPRWSVGDQVNLECDMVARYLERLLGKPAVTQNETGFERGNAANGLVALMRTHGFMEDTL